MVPTNSTTLWEIVIQKGDRKFRVQFSGRHTKQALGDGLFAIPQARRIEIFNEVKTGGLFRWNAKTKEYATDDGCFLRFSGLTERDIKNVA